MDRISGALGAGLAAVLLLPLCGCASLKDVTPVQAAPAPILVKNGPAKAAPTDPAQLAPRWGSNYLEAGALALLEQQATKQPLIAGNKLTLLYDGPQTMQAMTAAIRAATDHINLETYIFEQDAIGQQFAELLIAKRRSGVQVHVVYDAVGTLGVPEAFFQQMRDAGILLQVYQPLNPLRQQTPGWNPNQRDHRKLLVVDGKVGFTGGVNISSTYAQSSPFRSRKRPAQSSVGWRDTHVRIEGPAVAALQWEFLNTWFSLDPTVLAGSHFFPPLAKAGDTLVRVLASEPGGDQEIFRAHLLAIRKATRSVHITCAYFVPDALVREALIEAAARGVDVQLVLPGVREVGLAWYAGRADYQGMLQAGVRIHELQTTVLHAKTAVVDGIWSTIGSANLDTRSFLHNMELNLMVYDAAFAAALESAFAEDVQLSKEVSLQQWSERPLGERFKEWLASLLGYWL